MDSLARPPLSDEYDVVIIGGALSGSATAKLLKERNPDLSILIVERSESFTRRVGESTVEISSFFLGRVLGLTEYLNHNHLPKQGLRFYFHNKNATCFDSCSEIGPKYNVRLASYQVDRSQLDEHLLARTKSLGVEVLRPAEVKDVVLNDGGFQSMTIKVQDVEKTISTKWVVDASGVARFLARKNNWVIQNKEHPIASIWARFKNVLSWDNPSLTREFPDYAKRCFGTRSMATNHLVGDGWWSWWIPLKCGDISIGIVFDERHVSLPDSGSPLEKMRSVLNRHPLASRLLENAVPIEGDVHLRRNLPYHSRQIVGNGFALVGDAAGFIDPFYSPGMDWIAFTSVNIANHIHTQSDPSVSPQTHEVLNEKFLLSYDRWFRALYKDKYDYMGDFELMKVAFQLDVGLYYFGIVSQPYKYGPRGFDNLPFTGPHSDRAFQLVSFYNKRLAAIGRLRRRTGTFGNSNDRQNLAFKSYQLDYTLIPRVLFALLKWVRLELTDGWKTRTAR